MKIAIQQASLAQAGVQNIEVGQLSVGPVTVGQLTLNNVNFGFSTGQAALFNVSVELNLHLTLVWSVSIPLPWPLGTFTIATTTTDLGSLTLNLPLGNVNIPGIQQFRVTIAQAGVSNLQASVGPLSNLGLGPVSASQVILSNVTLPTGGFQLTGLALGNAQLAGFGLPAGSIGSVTIGELKGSAFPLAQFVVAGINLPRAAVANIVSGAISATAVGGTEEIDADLGVLDIGLRVTPTMIMNIGQLVLSGLTASAAIGNVEMKGITVPYDIRNLTLTSVDLNTLQIPVVGVA